MSQQDEHPISWGQGFHFYVVKPISWLVFLAATIFTLVVLIKWDSTGMSFFLFLLSLGATCFLTYVLYDTVFNEPLRFLLYSDRLVMVYIRASFRDTVPYSHIADVEVITSRHAQGGSSKHVAVRMEGYPDLHLTMKNPVGFCGALQRRVTSYHARQLASGQGQNEA